MQSPHTFVAGSAVFDEVYAPSTVGILLREFSFGHSNQLAAVARAHLIALAQRTPLLPDTDERMFLDIDSLLRPGSTGIRSKAPRSGTPRSPGPLLRKGLSPPTIRGLLVGHQSSLVLGPRDRGHSNNG